MKKFIVASLALGAALASIPSARADSFGYKTSGSIVISNPAFNGGPADFANGVAKSEAYSLPDLSGSFPVNNRTPITFGSVAGVAARTGSYANGLTLPGEGGFLFDNLFYPGNSRNGILDSGGVSDISGYELGFFSRSVGGSNGTIAASMENFYSANKASYNLNNEILRGKSALATATTTLTATPEPESLFLLGTGLLCLALFLFRRAAKRPMGS